MNQNSHVFTGMRFVTIEGHNKGRQGVHLTIGKQSSRRFHFHAVLKQLLLVVPLLLTLHLFSCSTPVVPPERLPVPGPDTTSHNWVFDPPILLGGAQSSALYDVAIVNDTLAYAVGEIYLNDSTGQVDPNPYNVAIWNGQNWTLSKATNVPLRALHAFSENNVWAGSSAPYHWNGTAWTGYNVTGIFGGYINAIWGTSNNNVYIVGTNGSIAHFNGTSWQKLESGTTLDFHDIWGDFNESTSEWEILGLASNSFTDPTDRVVVRILENNTVEPVGSSGSSDQLVGLWFGNGMYFSCGSGLYESSDLVDCAETCWTQILPPKNYLEAVRGNGLNDVIVVGHFYTIIHYNGASWREFPTGDGGKYFGVAIKDDLLITVGREGIFPALVTIGRRY